MEEKEICLKSNVSFEKLISLNNKNIIFKDNILVRETVGKKTLLVNKIKELDNNGVVVAEHSIKCPISDSLSGYNFLCSIGYKKAFELNDHNLLVTNGINEIYIQDVEGLGTYIEMEQKKLLLEINNGNTRDEFCGILERNMRPIYDAARRQGYEIWKIS